jgi:hypothetical protein
MAIHDAIVIVLCWFAFFVSMPMHLKFGGEGLRKSHEGASSLLQERRRFQTKGFAKATKIPKQKCAAFFAAPSSDCRCFQHFKNALCGKIHNNKDQGLR